jgi:nucleotide-binding universal stress UspA family protein
MSGLFRNILVAIDGSSHAQRALEYAIELARDQNARLTLVTVVPPPSAITSMAASGGETPESMHEGYAAMLRETTEAVPEDVGVTTRLLDGQPARRLVEAVREGSHDLVVMGSHGRGRVAGALLGSVSQRVLHDSPVPVLVARAGMESGSVAAE